MESLPAQLTEAYCAFGWPLWRGRDKLSKFFPYTVQPAERINSIAAENHLQLVPRRIIGLAHTTWTRNKICEHKRIAEDLVEVLLENMAASVCASNQLDNVGLDLLLTKRLFVHLFRPTSKDDSTAEIAHDHEDYSRYAACVEAANPAANQDVEERHQLIVKSRRAVINHAAALAFLVQHVVLGGLALSESLILEAHRILCRDDPDVAQQDVGQYRREKNVWLTKPADATAADAAAAVAGREQMRCSIRPQHVARRVRNMVRTLEAEDVHVRNVCCVDPYTLAADYHHLFTVIHPFQHGTGAMARIILNVLLLKFTGHMASFDHDGDKTYYHEAVWKAHEQFNEKDGDLSLENQTMNHDFAQFVLARTSAGLQRLRDWALSYCAGGNRAAEVWMLNLP